MDIIVLKLVTGEDVLGEVVASSGNEYSLKNPVGIAVVRGQNGQPNVGFTPFPLHVEQKVDYTISIPITHVVYKYEPAEDFKTNYNQIFGTGIITPPKEIILG